ncbi:MAG TPA: UDP-N-acetylmuramoyl-L-alanine--D-glutamate ligase, partial [Solirubrobacteraceae bacterium]|nr:UDP-N-acetylmuramoyl-L-alanine--D-glutamate ligase [Solirubrobacteraceae bacterium]
MSPAAQPPASEPGRAAGKRTSRHERPPLPQGPYAVLGLARSGKAAALALLERGEQVIGLDAGAPEGLDELAAAGAELHTGARAGLLPERARSLVKSPGVPREDPFVAAALARGLPVLGELELGWRLLANEFIAVTGTNGKTTTAELIGHVHREAGLPVLVAGNVGTALSSLAGTAADQATIVCETSSFQLEDSLAFAPEAAVLINLSPDHLDRHGSFAEYTRAKAGAFARQGEGDLAVLPSALLADGAGELARLFASAGRARRFGFGSDAEAALREQDGELRWQGEHLLHARELSLRGRHNLENAMAAAAVCLARGLDADAVRAGLRSFAGVAHRLELIATRDGVMFVNDSKATNVASTLVALDAFADRSGIRLILGGQGKGQDFSALRAPVAARCSGVYLIGE